MHFGFALHGFLRAVALIGLSISLWLLAAPAHAEMAGSLSSSPWAIHSGDHRTITAEISHDHSADDVHPRGHTTKVAVMRSVPHPEAFTSAIFQREVSSAGFMDSKFIIDDVANSDLKPDQLGETDGPTRVAFIGSGRDLTHLQIRPASINAIPLPSAFWLLLLALFLTALIAHRGNQITR